MWNLNAAKIPEGVKLGIRKEKWYWKELTGFGRTLNTIHGLIIEINRLLKFNDSLTRDNTTVQGCINMMNDIIDKIDTLVSGCFIIVDEYGRMKSSPYTTKQELNYLNVGLPSASGAMEAEENRWIGLNVDDTFNKPMITIEHKFNEVTSTNTNSNKNDINDIPDGS